MWRIGEESSFDPSHSTSSGYFYPYIGGTGAGSMSLGSVHDYVVDVEQRGSDNPWSDDSVIVADGLAYPAIESDNGTQFRVAMSEEGEITTEIFTGETTYLSRVVLEAPGSTLYEMIVTNDGILETITPPDASPPSPERFYGRNGYEYYELSVADGGYLVSRRVG